MRPFVSLFGCGGWRADQLLPLRNGARDRTRTCTLEILDPKSSVSANSTTRAYMVPEEGLEPSRLLGGF